MTVHRLKKYNPFWRFSDSVMSTHASIILEAEFETLEVKRRLWAMGKTTKIGADLSLRWYNTGACFCLALIYLGYLAWARITD